ncbi:MAG: SUMF1/EgtB/PvdO family nonheme iron enzyme [Pseudomonadota bacterium]
MTFDEFDRFCEQTGCIKPDDEGWGRGHRPAIHIARGYAEAYCARLSEMTGETYRLPSEAEWEYACRAGTATTYALGDELTKEEANINAKKPKRLVPIAQMPGDFTTCMVVSKSGARTIGKTAI